MGIQAREMARFAKANGITVKQGGQSSIQDKNLGHCARGVISHMVGYNAFGDVLEKNLTESEVDAIEEGFEGWQNYSDNPTYYRVGENFHRISREIGIYNKDYCGY